MRFRLRTLLILLAVLPPAAGLGLLARGGEDRLATGAVVAVLGGCSDKTWCRSPERASKRYIPFWSAGKTLHCQPLAGNLNAEFSATYVAMGGTGLEPVTSTV